MRTTLGVKSIGNTPSPHQIRYLGDGFWNAYLSELMYQHLCKKPRRGPEPILPQTSSSVAKRLSLTGLSRSAGTAVKKGTHHSFFSISDAMHPRWAAMDTENDRFWVVRAAVTAAGFCGYGPRKTRQRQIGGRVVESGFP